MVAKNQLLVINSKLCFIIILDIIKDNDYRHTIEWKLSYSFIDLISWSIHLVYVPVDIVALSIDKMYFRVRLICIKEWG